MGKLRKSELKGSRQTAFKILNRVFGSAAFADILLEKELESLPEIDRPLAMELVYGVLRWSIRIDWAIDSFSDIKVKKLEHSVLNALRIGAYQLLFLSRVPASAAINESVNLVKPGGAGKAGFVNAVLRKIGSNKEGMTFPDTSDPVRHVSVVYSHPEWLVKRWIERFGLDKAIEICKAGLSTPPKTLRANTLINARQHLIEELKGEGVSVKEAAFSPDGIEVVEGRVNPKDPRYYIQDEASQLIPCLLSPKSGEIVLDACSAPGGKTTHIAQLMRNTGAIYALDLHASRLNIVDELAKRLNVGIIRTMEADAEKPISPGLEFDAILCDSPCSGLGVLRRSPDIKLRIKEEDIKELSGRQKRILENVTRRLKKGGRVVYSVCTFEPEETEEVIRGFLSAHKDFALEDAAEFLPASCKGLTEGGFLRILPGSGNMDGFFAARLSRKGS